MPTPTFLKLKPEKRARIMEVALLAFATQDFEAVSITRLMQDLALPKGSFYQYFEDKRDFYFYLFEYYQQKKEQYLAQMNLVQRADFFEFWEEWLLAELAYFWQNPVEWAFARNAANERNSPALGNLQALIRGRVAQQFLPTLRQESRQGNLRQDAPLELQAHFLAQAGEGMSAYLLHKLGIDLPVCLREQASLPPFPTHEARLTIRQWIALLKFGIVHVNS